MAITASEASIVAAVAIAIARFPKNELTLKSSPDQNRSVTVVVSLSPVSLETICSPAVHFRTYHAVAHSVQAVLDERMYAVTF
jgi:hypothetical protein